MRGETAAEALRQIGDARAVEPLIVVLKDKDVNVRKSAAEALVEIGDPHAVELLINILKDEDKDAREKAATVLVRIYKSARLEEDVNNTILTQANEIKKLGRENTYRHTDKTYGCFGDYHTDISTGDRGFHADFSL